MSPMLRVSAETKEWNLQVTSLEGTANYTYDQLLAMPKTTEDADLNCYGALVINGNWGGVSLSYLLQQAGADPSTASSIKFHASDGYQAAIPIEMAMQQDVIVAYEKDGSPLSEGLRLVVPGENGNIWIAMITLISMSTESADVDQSGNAPARYGGAPDASYQTPTPSLSPTQNPSPSPTEKPTPTMTASLSESASALNYGDRVNFTVTIDGGNTPYTYAWYFDNQLAENSSSPFYATGSSAVGSHHVYVQVTDADNSSATTLAVEFNVLSGSSSSPGTSLSPTLSPTQQPTSQPTQSPPPIEINTHPNLPLQLMLGILVVLLALVSLGLVVHFKKRQGRK